MFESLYLGTLTMDPLRVEITRLIKDWQSGDETSERLLFEVLYRRLREIAASCLRKEARCRTLTPTELVHEAYVRLPDARQLNITDRGHFLALVARVMRRIVVDRARARKAVKRGSGAQRVDLLETMAISDHQVDEILAVDAALDRLLAEYPRQGQVVELCYFAGFSIQDAGDAIGISVRTAKREWQTARIWLKGAIDGKLTG